MEIPAHKKRFVLLAAFDAYAKTLGAARKANENAHCTNTDVDEKAVILEHLKAEYEGADGQLNFEGTPMGDAMSKEHYRDTDGTDLTADALDQWLRQAAGAAVPPERIAGWTLEQRKLVAAWLRAGGIELNEAIARRTADLVEAGETMTPEINRQLVEDSHRAARTCAPDFIDVGWFTERPAMTDAEVDEWVTRGPWGVNSAPGEGTAPSDEWELIKTVDGAEVDRSKTVYADLGSARCEAAERNRNLVEAPTPVPEQPEEIADLHPVST